MIRFLYNPTSWRDGPVLGGMADALVQPILPHLGHDHELTDAPKVGGVNVYYSFPNKYGGLDRRSTNVFVSHGIADKRWRNAAKLRGLFDFVFVSGPAWSMRLMSSPGVQTSRIVEAGYPKLDPIFNGEIAPPERDGRVRVVYAPTHGGGGEGHDTPGKPTAKVSRLSSHHHRDVVLGSLPPSEFDVVVALHPRHRPDGRSTLAEYVGADVVIADGGSTIYEAWALDIPVVFPSWLVGSAHRSRQTFEGEIYNGRIGWHVDRPADLARTVTAAARSGITDGEQDFIETILPRAYRGVSGRMHAEALDDIADGIRPVRHVTAAAASTVLVYEERGARREVIAGSVQHEWMLKSGSWRFVGWIDDLGTLHDAHRLLAEARTPARRKMLDRQIRKLDAQEV